MTKTIKDRIAKRIKKPTSTKPKKKSKIQPIDWYAKAAAKIAITSQNKEQKPTISK